MLAAVREQRLEGIVGKRKDSVYEPGKRSGAWIKQQGQSRPRVCHRRIFSRTARSIKCGLRGGYSRALHYARTNLIRCLSTQTDLKQVGAGP
jgi:hypothetical protein